MKKALAIAAKDIRGETRAKEIAPAMVLFALVLVFLFTLALPPSAGRAPVPEPRAGAVGAREVSGAFLWSALLFAAIVGFGRNAAAEREGNRIEALIMAPVDPAALFAGKALANFVLLCALELVMLPVFTLFLGIAPSLLFPEIIAVALAVNVGLAASGTLLGAASQYARAREVVLPLLAFPVMLPLVLAGSRLTSSLLMTGAFGSEARWFVLVGAFDLSITAIGAVAFEYVIRE